MTHLSRGTSAAVLVFSIGMCLGSALPAEQYLTPQDIRSDEPVKPYCAVAYGPDSEQYGHLRVPDGGGPFPVLVILHGGCWLSFADLKYMSRFAAAFTESGVATWSLEYRRIDSPGGGWPDTFLDVAKGIDHLRLLESKYRLDLTRVVVVGHSAGGHLALWAAGRPKIAEDSPLHSAAPLPISGVVSLAGPGQLAPLRDLDNDVCGGDVIDRLMEGAPDEVPGHYAAGSPIRLLPFGIPQRLLTGAADQAIPARFAEAYADAARKAGDDATAVTLAGSAHFEVIVPGTAVWPDVKSTILSLFEKRKP